jgi:hypothetical protein
MKRSKSHELLAKRRSDGKRPIGVRLQAERASARLLEANRHLIRDLYALLDRSK